MKNFFRIVMLALVVCATSCAREDISSNLVGGGDAIEVTFTADLGELGTRTATVGDGSHVDRVYLGIYENNQPLNYLDKLTEDEGYFVNDKGVATFSVVLLKDKVYDLVFWAQKAGLKTTEGKDVYNMDWKKRELTVDYTGVLSQAEERDAFYLVQKGFKAGHDETVFKLYRPFAQLNAGLSKVEVENITNNGVDVESLKSKAVVRKVANKLFLGQDNHGKIDKDNLVEVEFGSADKPAEELKVSSAVTGGPFEYVSLNYLLVNEEQLVEVDYTFTDNESTNYERTYYSVPVKRNYRTNIVGALLSSPIDFTVEIVPEFTNSPEEDYNREVWDGKSVSEPPYDATNKTYTVDEGSELAWLAAAVNGTLPDDSRATLAPQDFEGKTFVLSEDINLGGHDWTPISMSTNLSEKKTFRGTFDGQNHIISGLSVNQKEVAGLFGYVYAATIKNVIIDGASINSNHFAGGIVGWINNSKGNIQVPMVIENCHVKNSTIVSAAELVNGEWDNGDKVGGIVGYAHFGDADYAANEDAKIINCSVEETTIKAYRDFGGIAGYASHVALVNCTTSNVTLEQDLTHDYKAPETPTTFSLTIGRDNGGNTIDGNEYIADGVTFDEQAKTYYVSTAAGLAWVASVVNATTPYTPTTFDEATVELTNDIDLNNEEWIPIGDDRSQRTEWHGVFDGKDYTVFNVKITKKTDRDDENKSSYGLFGNVKGTVKNLTVENVSISGTPKFIGALVGRLNDGLIENCHVKSSNVECKNWTIGGLVGQFNNGKISGCSVEGTTVTGYAAVGAIVGIALNDGERIIENCSVKDCTIAQNGSFGGDFDKMFGAVAGALNNGALTVDFVNCTVENTTILDEISDTICGYAAEGDTILINGKPLNPSVEVNGEGFATLEEAITAAEAGDVVTIEKDVTLSAELVIPAGVTIVGNGKQINGSIKAGGDLTFKGHTKVTGFNVGCYDSTITIGEGDCLEVTGTNRASLGYGNTFDITSNITDAKSTDKEAVEPSLILPGGFSITGGNNAVFNIKNAYVKIGSTTSKNSAANGEFTINIENSIAEFTNQLTFSEPTNGKTPTFNLNVKNSVLTTATKLILSAPNCNMVVDNSTIDIKTFFRNSGNVELKNGSTLKGATIQFGENGGHDGATVVDNSKFTITASSTGHAYDGKGVGSVTAKNGAEVSIEYYKALTINTDATSTFTGTEVF